MFLPPSIRLDSCLCAATEDQRFGVPTSCAHPLSVVNEMKHRPGQNVIAADHSMLHPHPRADRHRENPLPRVHRDSRRVAARSGFSPGMVLCIRPLMG